MREKLLPQQVLEIDVEVAAYAMFQGIFWEAGEPCPTISQYFNNKKAIRTWLSEETGIHLDDVKAHLSAMHASQEYTWPLHGSVQADEWIESLRKGQFVRNEKMIKISSCESSCEQDLYSFN